MLGNPERHPAPPNCFQGAPVKSPPKAAFSQQHPGRVNKDFYFIHFFFLLSMLQMHLDWNMCQRRFDNDTQTSSTACCPFKWFRGKRKKTVICSWEKPNNKLVSFQGDRAGHLLETKARMWLPVLPLWLTSAVNWGTLCGFQKLPLSCGR